MPAAPQTPAKTSSAGLAPERSLTQRMDALKRANEIRTRRARLKRDLKAGRAQIHGLLLDPPEYLLTAKVFDLLLAVPKYGRVKVNRILTHCRISPSKTIGGLSAAPAQRAGLVPAAIAPILVITGPSGVGKGTLIKGLLERVPGLQLAVSATTRRAARGRGERGRLSLPERRRLRSAGARGRVRRARGIRRKPLWNAEIGAQQARPTGSCWRSTCRAPARCASAFPRRCRSSSSRPRSRPSKPAWRAAGSDQPEQIERRLAAARAELEAAGEFDHRIVNDDLQAALRELAELAATMYPA